MPGVKHFVDQRQQALPTSQGHKAAQSFKVPVPPTKLQHSEQRTSVYKLNASAVPIHSPRDPKFQAESHSAKVSNGSGNGFDTDAEGLDDTATTCTEHGSKGHPGNEDDMEDSSHAVTQATNGSGRRGQIDPPFAIDAENLSQNDDSYEESAEEESDEHEGDEEGEYEETTPPDPTQGLNSPGYAFYRQQGEGFSKEAAFKQVMDSPSMRNFDVNNLVMRNARSAPSRTVKPFQSRGHGVEYDFPGQHADAQGQDQLGLVFGKNPSLPTTILQQPNKRSKASPSPISLLPSLQTRSTQSQNTQQHFNNKSQQPSPRVQSDDLPREKAVDYGLSNGTNLTWALGGMMPPRPDSGNTGEQKGLQEASTRPNAGGETPFDPDKFLDSGDVNFLSGGKHNSGDTEHRSTASEEFAMQRKRGRGLDYTLDELANMEFDQLNAEAFQFDPQAKQAVLPVQLSSGTLTEKMHYLVMLDSDGAKLTQQKAFLATLAIEDYEECADIMVERFSEFVKTFKNARQHRRKVAKDFETEVAKREQQVRLQIQNFENDLGRLKRDGEDVVRRKLAM